MTADDSLLKQPLWILAGQLGLVFAVFVGFGARGHMRPQLAIAGLLVCLTGAIALGPVGQLRRVVVTVPVAAMVTWWTSSFLWTENVYGWWTDTQQTLPYVVTCVVLVALLPTDKFRAGLVAGCYLVIANTMLEVLIRPGAATVNPDGNPGWRGSFIHKNEMAPFMVLALLIIVSFGRRSPWRVIGIALGCVLIVNSRSTTALGAGMVTLAVALLLRHLAHSDRRARASAIVGSLVAMVSGWVLYSTLVPTVLEASGKDTTLTGRTDIWSGVWNAISRRPWQGYGIGGVWTNLSVDPALSILDGLGFVVKHSHNGYLEVLLLLGFIGLALVAWLLLSLLRFGLVHLYTDPAMAIFSVSYVVLLAVLSVTEVTTFRMWLALLCTFQTAALIEVHRERSATRALSRSAATVGR